MAERSLQLASFHFVKQCAVFGDAADVERRIAWSFQISTMSTLFEQRSGRVVRQGSFLLHKGFALEFVGGGSHGHTVLRVADLLDHAVVHYGQALRQRSHQPQIPTCTATNPHSYYRGHQK